VFELILTVSNSSHFVRYSIPDTWFSSLFQFIWGSFFFEKHKAQTFYSVCISL